MTDSPGPEEGRVSDPPAGRPPEESSDGATASDDPGGIELDLSEDDGDVVDEIDLTDAEEVAGPGDEWSDQVVTQSYRLAAKREDMRGKLAFGLLLLLGAVVLLSFGTVWIRQDLTPEVKDLLTLIFGPIATLVGAATGYYFGGRGQGQQAE